jgi:hypothetical protein
VGGHGILDVADIFEHGDAILVVERGAASHHLENQHS